MGITGAFGFMMIGAILIAVHNYICKEAVRRAYSNGYKQAQKEERIRMYSTGNIVYQDKTWYERPVLGDDDNDNSSEVVNEITAHKERKANLSPSFMENLHNKGKAVTKIQ